MAEHNSENKKYPIPYCKRIKVKNVDIESK